MFITIEGGEGGGKSTNIAFIKDYLEKSGKQVLVTREPGGTSLGEKIREVLLDPENNAMCDDSELLLMFAARAQHIAEVIQPALNQGKWVLCDRFTDATYAYQGGGRGISAQRIALLEQWVQGELRPDLTLLFDLPVEVGMQRASQRAELDRFEQEKLEFFNKIRNSYLAMAKESPERYRILNAEQALEKVQQDIQSILDAELNIKGNGK
jgi:dTMP kinase